MHKARAFFFVCLGILCIVAAYHLGARTAGAQSGTCIIAGGVRPWRTGSTDMLYVTAVGSDRSVYYQGTAVGGPVPGSAPIVAAGSADGPVVEVLLGDGGIYVLDPPGEGTTWRYYGSACGGSCGCGPVPAQGISIGQLKAKYATPAGK